MKNITKKILFIIFFALLIVLSLATVFSHKKEFSENENRYLEEFPEFSIENVLSKKYTNGLENYVSDHFIGRSFWIAAKTDIELLSGKNESNGVFILDDRMVEKLTGPDYDEVDKSIEAINRFSEENNIPAYLMLAPTATDIYSEKLPKNAPGYDEKKFIDYVYEKLSENVTSLDIYNALYSNRDEYIYYRNDHHWTTLGAYYAYSAVAKKIGFNAVSWNKYDIEHSTNSFRGTLYSKTLYDKFDADTIDLYNYNNGVKVSEVDIGIGDDIKTYNSMYFKDFLDTKDKYSVFFGTNQPVVTVKTNSEKGKKLLIFKDSYAHCFVPFLTQHYSEITMVDMRYINTDYNNVIDVSNYNQVLFLYNASTFANETSIKKLNIN